MTAVALPPATRVHYGWVVVAASLVISMTAYGVYFSFTLFYPLLVDEFGWSRGAASGAMSVGLVAYGVFALPVGWVVDRVGPRPALAVCGLVFGLGTFLGSRITELWHLYALYGCLTAIGQSAAWAPLISTISRWFVQKRGLAVGLGTLGAGTGGLIASPAISYLIETYGWRDAYAITGIVSGLLFTGAALFMSPDPRARGGGLPYGAPPDYDRQTGHSAAGVSAAEAMRTRSFWVMIATASLWWFGGSIIYVQLAPFVREKGFDATTAALAVAAFGAGSGIGKVSLGLISDRAGARLTFAVATLIAMVAMLLLVPAGALPAIVALAFVCGVSFGGGGPQLGPIVAGLFGLRAMSTLMGTLMALMGTLGAGGPVLGGVVFDLTGSYAPAYLSGAALLLLSTVTLRLLPRSTA